MEDDQSRAPDMRGQIDGMIQALTGGDIIKTGAVAVMETWTAPAGLNAKAREYGELEVCMNGYEKQYEF
jgi:hypothetical protein